MLVFLRSSYRNMKSECLTLVDVQGQSEPRYGNNSLNEDIPFHEANTYQC